jgi:hypothetical protein
MSVMDELRALEQRVEKRLRELAPKVAEYRDLEKVAERLGIKRDPLPEPTDVDAETTKPAAAAKRTPKPSRTAARKPRAAGSRAAKGAATTAASTAASDGASTAAASAPERPRAASRKRAPKAKPKPASTSAPAAGAKRSTGSRRRAAAPGQREQDVLRLVSERPGITVAQLAEELKVDATGLYGVVRRLQGKGQLSKDGTALHPVAATASPEPTAPEPSEASSSASDPPAPPSDSPVAGS